MATLDYMSLVIDEADDAAGEAAYERELKRQREQGEISPVTYWSQVANDALEFPYSKATLLMEARSMLIRLMDDGIESMGMDVLKTQLLINQISNELDRRAGSQARNLMEPIQERLATAQRNLEANHFGMASATILGMGMTFDRERLEQGSTRRHVMEAIERISGMRFTDYCAKIGKDIETLRELIEDTENESAKRA